MGGKVSDSGEQLGFPPTACRGSTKREMTPCGNAVHRLLNNLTRTSVSLIVQRVRERINTKVGGGRGPASEDTKFVEIDTPDYVRQPPTAHRFCHSALIAGRDFHPD